MKFISWNVNGIRAVLGKGFLDFVKKEKPDLLSLQEVKAEPAQVDLKIPGYEIFWNPATKKRGYAGTAILSSAKPLRTFVELGMKQHDGEGRVITAEFKNFYFITAYFPNSKDDLSRIPFKVKFNDAILKYVKKLE